MKTMKKVFAFALAMVMMLAMTVTVFAENENPTSVGTKITVNNLSTRDDTVVSIYEVAELAANGNSWVVADWAKEYVDLTTDPAGINWNELENVVRAKDSAVEAADSVKSDWKSTVEFTGVNTGLYLVLATGSKVTYLPMGAVTYATAKTNPYIVAADASVVAKSSTSTIDKEANDQFVSAEEEINFTITTMIPFNKTEFSVTDKMTNLSLKKDSVKVTIGGETVSANFAEVTDENGQVIDGLYNMNLNAYVAQVGKTVVITYTAKVVGANGYTNEAWDNINGENGKETVIGYTGSATITKYDAKRDNENNKVALAGAKFTVLDKDDKDAVLKFTKVSDGEYIFSNVGLETELEVDENGVLTVTGLDEGKYAFHEVLAPVGYSLNTVDTVFEIVKSDKENVSVADLEMVDTKLSALPATGGIGTMIFTIVGCAIMVVAAGLFFVSRRKNAR